MSSTMSRHDTTVVQKIQELPDLSFQSSQITEATPYTLLDLPSEIRRQIWRLLFTGLHLAPSPIEFPTFEAPWRKSRPTPDLFNPIFDTLLLCKQIYNEASSFFYSSLILHTDVFPLSNTPTQIRKSLKTLALDLYIQEESRRDCLHILGQIESEFPSLSKLIIHFHLRPPMGYEELLDAAYLACPLVNMRSSIHQDLHFEYQYEEVMFESPLIGEIWCSDALEEHELVIRDLFHSDQFLIAAKAQDFNGMCFALMEIARVHERSWVEKLQRRRLARDQAGDQ